PGRVRFTARLEGTPAAGAGPLRAGLRYQACNDSRCLPPRTLELVARGERLSAPAGALTAGPVETRVRDWIEGSGYALTFLWVALLGLALNLTPCVYPLISVTVAFFGGTTGATGRPVVRALGLGAPYVGLAAAAGRLRRLPRSGPWLEWVERAFAFLLLGLAVYFLAPLLRAGTVRAAYAFLGVAAGIVLGFLTPGDRRTA